MTGKFHFSKYKKFFWGGFFFIFWAWKFLSWNIRSFLSLGLESSISQNIRKTFRWENIRNFFKVDFFTFFYFSSLGWKVCHVVFEFTTSKQLQYTCCPISQEVFHARSKGNQETKFGQLTWEIFFFKNNAENETGRLVPELFLFYKKALYKVKASFSCYISLTDEVSLSGCFYFLRSGQYVYCNYLFHILWRHKFWN